MAETAGTSELDAEIKVDLVNGKLEKMAALTRDMSEKVDILRSIH